MTGKSGERIRQITIPDTFGHVGNHAYLKGIDLQQHYVR